MVRKTSDTSLLDRLGVEKRFADLTDPSSLVRERFLGARPIS
jgi:hypothetical protein